MARGRAKKESVNGAGGMPSFVDVKLTAEQKAAFSAEVCDAADLVGFLVSLCDDGYRVGCTWSSEQQAYTVSLTCRDEESVNYGLCMTSFARDLLTAVALARFKHTQVTQGEWKSAGSSRSDDFG